MFPWPLPQCAPATILLNKLPVVVCLLVVLHLLGTVVCRVTIAEMHTSLIPHALSFSVFPSLSLGYLFFSHRATTLTYEEMSHPS